MISSMTGFGRAEVERNGCVLLVEARSVNHRFLELSMRLPRVFQPLESRLRRHLQKTIHRGKVNVTVAWKGPTEEGGTLAVNMDLARRYVEILSQVRAEFNFREPVTLGHVMSQPDVLRWEEPEVSPEEGWDHLMEAVDLAVRDLMSMRKSEGEALARDLLERAAHVRRLVEAVEARAPERVTEAKERLRSRIQELLEGEAEVDPERLNLEAAFHAERMDCIEECVRLRSHVEQMEALLREGDAAGRKLNFLTQELNREANTIGSKANDIVIAREVIEMKQEIEIIREQIQNVE